MISIRDTGIGMSEETIAELCSPFHQADASMARRFGGTGLGLAIAKRLLTLLNGDLRIQSTPDQGSVFVVSLRQFFQKDSHWMPWQNGCERSDEPGPAVPTQDPRQLVEKHILLVEDCRDSRRLFTLVLEKSGAVVTVAENGSEAVEKMTESENRHYDLVLMDIQMPVMDGYEATATIRRWEKQHDLPRVPIIALTANTSDEDRDQALESGMDDFAANRSIGNACWPSYMIIVPIKIDGCSR